MQSQKAVSAYFTSKQILPFAFAEQHSQENRSAWLPVINMIQPKATTSEMIDNAILLVEQSHKAIIYGETAI